VWRPADWPSATRAPRPGILRRYPPRVRTGVEELEALVRDPAFLAGASPRRLAEVLSGIDELGSAVLRAYRRALPRLLAAPGPERLGLLRAMAAAEEPDALSELATTEWERLWFFEDMPSAFHVRLPGHKGNASTVAFAEVGGRAVVAGDGTLRWWDPRDQTVVGESAVLTSAVTAAVFGEVLAVGDVGGTVWLWDPGAGEPVPCVRVDGEVVDLAFVGRDLLAVAFTSDLESHVYLYDALAGERVRVLLDGSWDTVLGLAAPVVGNRTVVAAVSYETVYLWDPVTGDVLTTWSAEDTFDHREHESYQMDRFDAPLMVGVLDQRAVLGVAGVAECGGADPRHEDRTVVFWDVRTHAEVTRYDLHCDEAPVAVTTVAGESLMATATYDQVTPAAPVRIRRLDGEPVADLLGHTSSVNAASFGQVGGRTHLATADSSGQVFVWDVTTAHRLDSTHGHTRKGRSASGIAFVPGTERPMLVTGDHSHRLCVRDALTGDPIDWLDGTAGYDDQCRYAVAAGSVATEPRLVSSGDTSGIPLWNPVTREKVLTLDTHGGPTGLAFGSAGGRDLVAVGAGIWDAVTGERVAVLRADTVTSVAFGVIRDDQPVVATLDWGRVDLWDPLTGGHIAQFRGQGPGRGVAIGRVDDRDVLIAGTATGVRLWDIAEGTVVSDLAHPAPVTCLALHEGTLATGTKDGTVMLWYTATRSSVLATFAHPVHAITTAAIDDHLHVFAQADNGHGIAWRID
jgi:WD40 repeat protein